MVLASHRLLVETASIEINDYHDANLDDKFPSELIQKLNYLLLVSCHNCIQMSDWDRCFTQLRVSAREMDEHLEFRMKVERLLGDPQ